ncbi:MAG: response regulator [Anaerocolumna sp.]
MYSLLLVDDEKLELETLRDYVDWNELEIGAVYTALNGKEAYSKVMEFKPDIMITDIHMPVMNGVELVKKLYEEQVTTKIIFLTGYDDFEFIKVAFSVEAIDYILKPFTIEVINNAIGKVIQVLDKEQELKQSVSILEKKLLRTSLSGQDEIRNGAVEQFKILKKDHSEMLEFGIIQAVGNTEQIDSEAMEGKFAEIAYAIKEEGRSTFLVLYFVNFLDSAKRIAKYYETAKIPAVFLYSSKRHKVEALYQVYHNFIIYNPLLFYENTYAIREVTQFPVIADQISLNGQDKTLQGKTDSELHKENRKKIKDILQHAKTDKNLERIKEFSTQYFQEAKLYKQEKKSLLEEVSFLFADIYDMYVEDNVSLKELIPRRSDVFNRMYQVMNAEELEAVYLKSLNLIFGNLEKNTKEKNFKDKNGYIVQCVKNYIKRNYANVITIESIAKEIGLSPNEYRNKLLH